MPSSEVFAVQRTPPARVGDALQQVQTPALVVDLDVLERNVQLMANAVRGSGLALRPHAKSHKCPPIAKLQIGHGAVGVCCQTVREAEVMVVAGVPDVLVTNQIVGEAKHARLARLARDARVGALVDDAGVATALGAAAVAAGVRLRALVEVDVGAHRCGVAPGDPAVRLAQHIAGTAGLTFGGIQAYQGAAQHLRTPAERTRAIAEATDLARTTRDAIERAGVACPVVTGAGTGTWQLERDSGVYTELQPGSYVVMDADYGRNALASDQHAFEQSLFLLATVISAPSRERVIVDAGLKAVAFDSGVPLVHARRGLEYRRASDEHGVVDVDLAHEPPAVGEHLWLVPGHCDPTVNLHDWIVGMRGQVVECVWPVAARGY